MRICENDFSHIRPTNLWGCLAQGRKTLIVVFHSPRFLAVFGNEIVC
jgi:hypothetical protein